MQMQSLCAAETRNLLENKNEKIVREFVRHKIRHEKGNRKMLLTAANDISRHLYSFFARLLLRRDVRRPKTLLTESITIVLFVEQRASRATEDQNENERDESESAKSYYVFGIV